MMRFCVSAFFFLSAFILPAQQSRIITGEEFQTVAGAEKDLFINSDSSGFYLINNSSSLKDGECFLYKFSSLNSKKIYQKQLNFNYTGTLNIIAAENIKGRIYLFIQRTDLVEKKVHLLKREFNTNTGEEIGEAKVIEEFEFKFETDVLRTFTVIFSSDNSKVLILKEELTDSRDQIVHAKVYLVNGFKKLWEQFPNTDSENQIPAGDNYLLDNEGRFCYLFETIENNHGIKIIYDGPSQNKTLMLPTTSITILNPTLENVNNLLICTGEFLEGERKFKRDDIPSKMGFFFLQIDPAAAQVKTQSMDLLSTDLQNKLTYNDKNYYYKFEGIKSFHYGNKTYKHYKTFYLNGCFYVIKYHGYIYFSETLKGDPIPYPALNEIIVMKYKDFKLDWMRLIPGKNSSGKKTGINFVLSDKLHLFYFDDPVNLQRFREVYIYDNVSYKTVNNSSATLIHAVIDASGKIDREIIKTDKSWRLHEDYSKTSLKHFNATIINSIDKKKRRFDLIKVTN